MERSARQFVSAKAVDAHLCYLECDGETRDGQQGQICSAERADVIGVFNYMNARRSGKLSTCLLDPELIHAGKNRRVLGLKNVPKIEVDHGPVKGKSLSEMLEDMTGEFEAEKFQLVLT